MKNWKTVAQNVLSGCVGGLLVISTAQAQKSKTPTQYEVRTNRLVLVDEKNKQCGLFEAVGGDALIELKSGRSWMNLDVSDVIGPSLTLGRDEHQRNLPIVRGDFEKAIEGIHGVTIEANNAESGLTASSNNYHTTLTATENDAEVSLSKNGGKQIFMAKVDKGSK